MTRNLPMQEQSRPEAQPDDAVGYGRPPKQFRFISGKSGNPKGRPKGSRSPGSLLDEALSAPITIVEGGTTKMVEQRAALFKALVARAIKGDVRAAALVVSLMEKLHGDAPEAGGGTVYVVTGVPRSGDGCIASSAAQGEDP